MDGRYGVAAASQGKCLGSRDSFCQRFGAACERRHFKNADRTVPNDSAGLGDDVRQRFGRLGPDVEDHIVVGDFIDAFDCRLRRSREFLGDDNIGWQWHLDFGHDGFGLVNEIGLGKRLADFLASSKQEGIGDAAADNQLVDLGGQTFQHGQLGRDLGTADDGDKRACRPRQCFG